MSLCPKTIQVTRGSSFNLSFNSNHNDLLLDLNQIAVTTETNTSSMIFIILACFGFGQGSVECKKIYCDAKATNKLHSYKYKDSIAQIYYKENTKKKVIFEHNFILFVNYLYMEDMLKIKDILANSINWINISDGKVLFNIVIYGNPPSYGDKIAWEAKCDSFIKNNLANIKSETMFYYINTKYSNTLAFSGSNPAGLKF
jgi:hypothetical protein